jgi:hypothetical protein
MMNPTEGQGPPDRGLHAPRVPASPELYVTSDESLVIDTWSSTAPAPLIVTARVLTPEGRIDTLTWSNTPHADRSRATNYFTLAEGWLLSVSVDATGLAYRRGQCWCQIALMRGAAANGVVESTLISDYIAGTARLAWYIGNVPAAGAEIAVTVPVGALWRVLALSFALVTDGNGGNRTVTLYIDDGTYFYAIVEPPVQQGISGTRQYSYAAGYPVHTPLVTAMQVAIPQDLRLPAGCRIRTITTGIDAGDQYNAPALLVEEWMQP